MKSTPKFLSLTTFPNHASGNVGDKIITVAIKKLIEKNLEKANFNVHFRREEFSSRLEYLNSHDCIILFGFPFLESQTRPKYYRICEDIGDVEIPIIPIGAAHKFFPGSEEKLNSRHLDPSTKSFIDNVVSCCPEQKMPVRTEWVGQVLRQNGYDTVLTGDPAWYDPDMIGQPFHRPDTIDQLVFTTPHSALYLEQAKDLLSRLGRQYPDARRTMVLHSAPTDVDRNLYEPARDAGFELHYASHDAQNLEMYRQSDLHVGYRKHGHLAHLRWRRPSVVLAEDSRAAGLNATLGTAGVRAFRCEPETSLGHLDSLGSRLHNSRPIKVANRVSEVLNFSEPFPTGSYQLLQGSANPDALDETFEFIRRQFDRNWQAYDQVKTKIDETYRNGMKPFLKDSLRKFYEE